VSHLIFDGGHQSFVTKNNSKIFSFSLISIPHRQSTDSGMSSKFKGGIKLLEFHRRIPSPIARLKPFNFRYSLKGFKLLKKCLK
jgi:hypothetical protein